MELLQHCLNLAKRELKPWLFERYKLLLFNHMYETVTGKLLWSAALTSCFIRSGYISCCAALLVLHVKTLCLHFNTYLYIHSRVFESEILPSSPVLQTCLVWICNHSSNIKHLFGVIYKFVKLKQGLVAFKCTLCACMWLQIGNFKYRYLQNASKSCYMWCHDDVTHHSILPLKGKNSYSHQLL